MQQAKGWRQIALPTQDELYDYMAWLSEATGIEISQFYTWYLGYETGELDEWL